jgi:hypothetical protein
MVQALRAYRVLRYRQYHGNQLVTPRSVTYRAGET